MFSGELPHIDNLYYAVGTVAFRGVRLSATGLGDSREEAETLRDAEIAERKSVMLQERAETGREAVGTAAGANPEMARAHAVLEAVERDAGRRWWLQGGRGAKPAADDLRCFEHLQRTWRRSTPRQVGLLDITPRHGVSVFAAWSCADDGRDLCFGTACRLRRSDAIRAALKELHQMEFGLDVIRYRQSNGVDLGRWERARLARSRRLTAARCRKLLNAGEASPSERPEPLPETAARIDAYLATHGITIDAAELPRTDDRFWAARAVLRAPRESTASSGATNATPAWARWELY